MPHHLRAALTAVLLATPLATSHAAKENFDRSKPHVNIGTIGTPSTGTSALGGALLTLLNPSAAKNRDFDVTDDAGPGRAPVSVSQVSYQTDTASYQHTACGDHPACPTWLASDRFDAVVLYVSVDAPDPAATREHILLARQSGAPALVVWLNGRDGVPDPRRTDRLLREVLGQLEEAGVQADAVLTGSAQGALDGDRASVRSVGALLGALEDLVTGDR